MTTQIPVQSVRRRNAAYLDAYRVAASLVLLGVMYIAVGQDLGIWWVPSSFNEWNLIFWGLFLYFLMLPSAFLVWREPDRSDDLELQDV